MFFTHLYDRLIKVVFLTAGTCLIITLDLPQQMELPAFIALVIAMFLLHIAVLRTLGSYLYCRLRLNMPVNLRQAAALNNVLCPYPHEYPGTGWLPLKEVKALDPELRYAEALKLKNSWYEQLRLRKEQEEKGFADRGVNRRLLMVICGMLAGFGVFTLFAGIPPASWLIDLYCRLFDTVSYPPALIGMILVAIAFLPAAIIRWRILRSG